MKYQYHLDFENYSLDRFFNNLRTRDMIPSRMILKEELDERFKILEDNGITNLNQLVETLKTKQKIESFSNLTGLKEEYLAILNREAKSFLPNPIRLDKFSGIANKDLVSLDAVGIKNTRHMINQAHTKDQRKRLSKTTGISLANLDKFICLSDLVRAYGVGPVFAQMIYDMGIKTIKEFVGITAEEFITIYEEKTLKKADFGTKDIQLSLELARDLEQFVEI